jgi:hypothetical protein
MLLTDVIKVVIAPFRSMACGVGSRIRVPGTGLGCTSRKKRYTLPLLDYSDLSSLYFAIDKATSDDQVQLLPLL